MKGELVAGRYRLAEPIGEGATGTVYRAVVEPGGEAVAVKVLRAGARGAAATEAARRFEREAVAAGKLDHPNLVAIRDFGALDDGRPYLVMDLIDGRSLAEVLGDEGRLPVERALAIVADVLRGLGRAHEGGVVHRDLKPADILLVERDGAPEAAVLVDFGGAALVGAAGASAEQLTGAGAGPGAPAYMAPERLDPDAGSVDGRADLYSATCVLFEMLTGRPPHGAAGAVAPEELVARHARGAAPRLVDAVPELEASAALEAIVARGLARAPADRFADAGEYLRAVEALREGRLDAAAVGRPESRPAGKLAEPDPSKATTVFHGAPRSAGAAPASAASAPAGAASSAAAAPSSPAAPPAAVRAPVSTAAAARSRAIKLAILVGSAVVLVLAIGISIRVLSQRGGTGDPGDDPMAGALKAWRAAGLEPGEFAPVDGGAYGGGVCKKGVVSGVVVVLCQHPTPQQALMARRAGLRAMRGAGGARSAIPSGKWILFASMNKPRDPERTLSRVTKAFQSLAPEGGATRPRRAGGSAQEI
ncbi:MAG TPA: serine/threonine-protein kinase [Kofleriaceae bacterium]|nr:serine/threonine-protein kinase [Kofleriaceae bacterium]